jgi:hypothetical protein
MSPTGVVGVIVVGVEGRDVRSANATVPFLARLIGHGVESAIGNPLIVRFKVPVPLPHVFDAVNVMMYCAGLVGVPVMFPLVAFIDKPWGRKFALKFVGLWFVLNRREHGTPVAKVTFVTVGVNFGALPSHGSGSLGVNAASIISLSSTGTFVGSLRIGRVGRPGRSRLAYIGNPPRFISISPPSL